jgi:preprotein translocase subunit Sec61beta
MQNSFTIVTAAPVKNVKNVQIAGLSGRRTYMPKKRKKRRRSRSSGDGPMPSGGAGLIRFFEDETPGIKVGPTVVVVFAAVLLIATVISHILI